MNHDNLQAPRHRPSQQIAPSTDRRRAPLSTAERWSAGAVALALVGFFIYGHAVGSPSTVGYSSAVVVIGALVVWLRRTPLPGLLAPGLAVAAIVTLAGPHAVGGHRRELLILSIGAALGLGGLNEMVEFIATLAHHGAQAGGYWNTGWDLVCNCIGAVAAGPVIGRSRAGAA